MAMIHTDGSIEKYNYKSEQEHFRTQAEFSMVRKLLTTPRYEIPEHLRKQLVEDAADVSKNCEDPKTRIAAMRVLAELDKINVEIVKISMPKRVEHTHRAADLTMEELEDLARKATKFVEGTVTNARDIGNTTGICKA